MRLIVCSAGESGKAPVPFPRTPKNLGFVSGKELTPVHLPTPHALTTSHRSRKAAGSKGLEGVFMGNVEHKQTSRKKAGKTRENLNF